MNQAVPGRSLHARLASILPRRIPVLAAAALFASFAATASAQAGAAAAPSVGAPAAPQVIAVPVPASATQAPTSNTPSWNSTNPGGRSGSAQDAANPAGPPTASTRNAAALDTPTEFQNLVAQTLGTPLPIFGSNLFNNAPSTFAPVRDAQVPADYVIGAGDEIVIAATGQLNQQGSFTVNRAGTISIPEVGALSVAGLHFSDLKPFLQSQIGRIYRNFTLNVTLGQLRSIQVYVLGETRQPGAYTVSSLSTLVNALFDSGGVKPQGSLRRIELRRAGTTITTIDLYDLLLRGDKSKDVSLQPGDIIFVPTAGPQVAVVGSVVNPAIYELRGEETVRQLLDLANGLTSTATGQSARIESIYNHSQRAITDVSLAQSSTLQLHDGDIITVAAISDQYRNSVTLRGNVANPGRYTWHAGMRLSDLIPNRESLVTRNYYRSLNALGQPSGPYGRAADTQQQGRLAVSTAPSSGTQGTANGGSTPDSPTPTAANTATSNGGGTTVGDALTQNSGIFSASNDVILNAPDVDLAYAVIERLDPVALTTSLIPFNLGAMLNADSTQNLALESGDVVTIFSKADIRVPQVQQTRFVRLEGEFPGAGVYSVKPGETLRQLIIRAGGLTPEAYLYASEFTRQSTRRVEAQRLREYADTLDAQINTEASRQISTALNPSTAAQSTQEAANSARAAVARLRAIQPTGRIVLKLKPDATGVDSLPDMALEDGDRFIVPRQPTSVSVSGQVYNASAFLYKPNLQVRDYLRDAGGPDRSADLKRVFVIRADGSVVSRQYADVSKATVLPGDTVVVPPQLSRGNFLRDAIAITSALGTLALPLTVLALVR